MSTDALLDSASSCQNLPRARTRGPTWLVERGEPPRSRPPEAGGRTDCASHEQEEDQAAEAGPRSRPMAASRVDDAPFARQTRLAQLADDAVAAAELEDLGAARSRFASSPAGVA